jgi:hypothetical protein
VLVPMINVLWCCLHNLELKHFGCHEQGRMHQARIVIGVGRATV